MDLIFSSSGNCSTNRKDKHILFPLLSNSRIEADVQANLKKQCQHLQPVEDKIFFLMNKGKLTDLVFITFLEYPFFFSRGEEVGRLYITRVKKKNSFTSCFQSQFVYQYSSSIFDIIKQESNQKIVKFPKFPKKE